MPKFNFSNLGNVECNKDNDCLFGQKCRKKTNKCEYKNCNKSRDCAGHQKCRGRKCVPICKYVLFITSYSYVVSNYAKLTFLPFGLFFMNYVY